MIYQFGNFELNTDTRKLIFNETDIAVQRKVFEVLVFLVENRDRAISKDELQDAIWKNLEISETALTRTIMKARKALDQESDSSEYIETIHGHGYRFVHDVKESQSKQTIPSDSALVRISWGNLYFISIAVFIILAGIVTTYFYSSKNTFTPESTIAILPIIDETNDNELSWISTGFMGLATEIIKAQENITTVSSIYTSKIKDIEADKNLSIEADTVISIKGKLKASHILIAKLTVNAESKQYLLSYRIYGPNGPDDIETVTGDNPTMLCQLMANSIISKLPGSAQDNRIYKAISDKPFINELYARGVALRLEGKIEQARDYFKLVMLDDNKLIWPRIEYAITTRRLGHYDDSIMELEKLLSELPDIAKNNKNIASKIQNAIANAYFSKSEHKEAMKHYEMAFNLAMESKNFDYAAKLASNMAWLNKDAKDYVNSKVWLSKSNQIRKQQNLPVLINNLFLLGQLEYLMNNFDKAETIYNEVADKYISANQKGNAAKVIINLSRIKRNQGLWSEARNYFEKSLKINTDIKNEVDILDNKKDLVSLYIDEGKYALALEQIEENSKNALKLEQDKIYQNTLKQKILVLFKQDKYQQALDLYKELHAEKYLISGQLDSLEALALKAEYLLGNKTPLTHWISEYQSLAQTDKFNNHILYEGVKIFLLEQNQDTNALKQAYRKYINENHAKGYYATAIRNLIKLANIYIGENDLASAIDTFNEIQFFELDWWQIQVLSAQIEFLQKNTEKAKSLVKQAKINSTDSWSNEHQKIYDMILSA